MKRPYVPALIAAVLAAVVFAFAHPKRQPMWQCPKCHTMNEAWRSYCMNGCSTAGPLAPRRPKP